MDSRPHDGPAQRPDSIVPGIVPILSGAQIKRFTAMCGARIPAALGSKLEELGDNDAAVAPIRH